MVEITQEEDLFIDEYSKKCLKTTTTTTRRYGYHNNLPTVPTLSCLCLLTVRGLRSRLEGLTFLPEEIVISIVEGSSSEELKQIEISNPDAPELNFWDRFWKPLCEKTMSPAITAAKPTPMSWRNYFLQIERETKDRFKEAGQRCRSRLNTLQAKRSGMVVLEDVPRIAARTSRFSVVPKLSNATRAIHPTLGATVKPSSTPQKAKASQLKLSNPAVQKTRKLPTLKSPFCRR